MSWWQLFLAAWALGAFAAFPSLFEFNASEAGTGEALPEGIAALLSVGVALLWPFAWLSLLYFTFRSPR